MSRFALLILGLLSFSLAGCFEKTGPCGPCETGSVDKTDYTAFVDTSIGTSYNGHTFIGATMPFGFVQPGPESGDDGWGYCSGYRFEDKVFSGFAQTAISGTGSTVTARAVRAGGPPGKRTVFREVFFTDPRGYVGTVVVFQVLNHIMVIKDGIFDQQVVAVVGVVARCLAPLLLQCLRHLHEELVAAPLYTFIYYR